MLRVLSVSGFDISEGYHLSLADSTFEAANHSLNIVLQVTGKAHFVVKAGSLLFAFMPSSSILYSFPEAIYPNIRVDLF